MQPVYVEDVAAAFVNALTMERAVREIYPLGGPERMTWPAMLETMRNAFADSSTRRPVRPIPAWKALTIARIAAALGVTRALPYTVDHVLMSLEDSTCETVRVRRHLGIEPMSLTEAVERYAGAL